MRPRPGYPFRITWLALAAGLAPVAVPAAEEHPGKALYEKHCATCHDHAQETKSVPFETLRGMRYGSIDANLERRTGRNCWIQMSLTEGKNREVRRVLEYLGLQVSRLIRTGYGPFDLRGLEPGGVDEIDRNQLAHFRNSLK